MTCETCRPWCAKTETQLQVRLERLKCPGVSVHPCDCCGSTAWASSREAIGPDRLAAGSERLARWWHWFVRRHA